MALAAVLFFVAGVLNGVYPGGSGSQAHGGYGWLTYVFGLLNLVVALWIWRGSERGLVTRIVLGAVFLAIVAALALAQPSTASLVLYVITGIIELVILLNAIRVWQSAREAESADVDKLLSLDSRLPLSLAPYPSLVAPAAGDAGPARDSEPLSALLTWILGLLPLALALVLVGDAISSGYIPGGIEWTFAPPNAGWLAYVLALVELVVAVRAVHGSILALRLLLAMSLIVVLERVYTEIGGTASVELALHAVAALLALATALAAVVALRGVARRKATRFALERATSGH
ncbi:MAG: hypothetical protein AUH85_07855 [Chloroflexi bacterium 13_1_40CM_4_68_4]|nr:MAG: hypothetical protein AUH85_07855 [Chloroflexi bacterium 13_1_40CM_4_68_4]